MDWIFENLFLIIIIISGIVAFLGDSKKKQEEQKKKQSTPPNKQTPSRQRQQRSPQEMRTRQQTQRKREQPRAERQVYREGARPDVSAGGIEEQQRKQMERMTNRYQTSSQEDVKDAKQNFKDLIVDRKGEADSPGKNEMKKRVSGNLDGKGLVNGIIMAEVLGPPRAKQPYRSIVQRRK
ncbi:MULTISPECIES: hypothetical protein [Oceanobacillus]|uniref:Uncharacterized protein n=1 Tax=Oceanobacillus aidingensis TaxID=645964 RepID=A0ABV9K4F3_9BACI|nr:hypothetical protein [Oceanobacillus oncorhynchi]MDM8099378.1 hypothetical protein [Oceanobacillus oncorhynchi]UUI38495.1 hypothetical protein NP440_14235 [Oceanobacillus oncorhynchi]